MNSNLGKMVLWNTSSPSSPSAGFPDKVSVLCPSNSCLDQLACHSVSSMSLDLVTKPYAYYTQEQEQNRYREHNHNDRVMVESHRIPVITQESLCER